MQLMSFDMENRKINTYRCSQHHLTIELNYQSLESSHFLVLNHMGYMITKPFCLTCNYDHFSILLKCCNVDDDGGGGGVTVIGAATFNLAPDSIKKHTFFITR